MGESVKQAERWRSIKITLPGAFSAGVAYITLDRPNRRNALNHEIFEELPLAISALDFNSDVRVIVFQASGNHFCAGIDLSILLNLGGLGEDGGRQTEKLVRIIKQYQAAFTAFEICRKPVIAAIHGTCIGGGIDLITACDLRYCTSDAVFCVKEVDMAVTADLGTLQRLPGIVGFGNAMDLALTGRSFNSGEAKDIGLVQGVFASKSELDMKVGEIARGIASKSPLAVMGTKSVMLKSRDLSIAQGLDYVTAWNAAFLRSEDLKEVSKARVENRRPSFAKL